MGKDAVCDIGILGSGVIGSNLALNIADKAYNGKPFEVALYDLNPEKVQEVLDANKNYQNLRGFPGKEQQKAFISALKKPRKIIILVPAGPITDTVINELADLLEGGDIIMDVGNANFRDQTRRADELEKRGLRFLGMGVSGGAEGARKGPAFFPGGTLSVWDDVKHIIEAAAAKAPDGRPCAVMNGKGGAGSCVKMFHNAGEYAVLQIWGEVHGIMKAYKLSGEEQAKILGSWKTKTGGRYPGLLDSYMLQITEKVVQAKDAVNAGGKDDGTLLISRAADKTDSKGTGLWSVAEALNAAVPVPSLVSAVLARQMSMCKAERVRSSAVSGLEEHTARRMNQSDARLSWSEELEEDIFWATSFSIIASYAQMFKSLQRLDETCGFGLNLPATIATFRAGCILQGFLLTPMTLAFENDPALSNLLVAFIPEITEHLPRMQRAVGRIAQETMVPIPVMSSSLDYIKTMLVDVIPSAQCVSLQRDVFGRHGFERLDKPGRFNATWEPMLRKPIAGVPDPSAKEEVKIIEGQDRCRGAPGYMASVHSRL